MTILMYSELYSQTPSSVLIGWQHFSLLLGRFILLPIQFVDIKSDIKVPPSDYE